jgi:3-isopropylmalate dehydratase small subunit
MAAAAAIVGNLADVRKLAPPSMSASKGSPKVEIQGDAHMEDITSDEDLDHIIDAPVDAPSHPASTSTQGASAGMPKFETLRGYAAPMDIANIDTDAIIPKQFLKTIKRSGLGSALFHGWRYEPGTDTENKDFVLNQEPFRNSKILVCTGPNFGCGSSREHAPWALLDFGIKCGIAPSYGDIFFNNTFKNGMLPIRIADQAALEKRLVGAWKAEATKQPASVDAVNAAEQLGVFYCATMQFAKAKPVFESALAAREKLIPKSDEKALPYLDSLALIYTFEGDQRRAQGAEERARSIRQKLH